MGNGSSLNSSRTIYVKIGEKREMIIFSRYASTADIISLLKDAAGASPNSTVQLKTTSGALLAISPTMPVNTPGNAYILTVNNQEKIQKSNGDERILQHVLSEVAQQFNKAVNFEQYKTKLEQRLASLENLVQREGIKLLEIEKCKKDISDVKNELYMAHKKMIDYNHLRPAYYNYTPFCSAVSDERKICLKRDVPIYPKTFVYISLSSPPSDVRRSINWQKKGFLHFEKYTLSEETIDYLKQPTFDIWHWEPNEMLCLLEHMYHELGLVKEFNMNAVVLKRWLLCVQENYRNNPFHNFRHCFCVTQMMYGIIHMCKLWEKVSREDLGIMITACICHDLDHPGYNNTYQINARTELAVRYNDISPLENHHCAVAFQILSNPEANIFGNVDHTTFKRIRSGIIMLVLATDMARHSEILDSFKSKLDTFDFSNEEHLNSMKMVMIKCCDISNEVRPFEVSEPWVDCLLEEYFNQSDREKEEGLPVAPFMDREKVTKPTAQIGFIKFVLIPMFETIAKLFPQLYDVMVKPLKDARDRYESMKEEADKEKAKN